MKPLSAGIVGAGADALPATEVSDGCITPETLQYDADLFFSAELVAGDTLDTPDELFGLLSSGSRLPAPV